MLFTDRRKTLITYGLVVIFVFLPHISFASGFRIGTQGAKATGMGNAFVATADDPSAIVYNPAGIADQVGTNVYLGTTAIIPSTRYEDPSGVSDETEAQTFYPSHLYISSDFGIKDMAFGLGIFSPFGLGTKWGKDSPLRYAATESKIETVSINPTVAYRLFPSVSVGIALNYMTSKLLMENMVNQSIVGGSDGELSCKADGDGWGYNIGLLFTPHEKVRIGATYRSSVKVDYDGTATLSNIAPALQPLFGGSSYKTDAKTAIEFPAIFGVGVAYKPTERLTLEVDTEWTGWSSYNSQDVDLKNEVAAAGFVDASQKKDWRDTWAVKVGAEYKATDNLSLRAGYAYDKTPAPDKTLDPRLPDSDQQDASVGIGYKIGRVTIDAAYMAVFYKDRDVSNSIASGEYKSFAHFVGVSAGYRF